MTAKSAPIGHEQIFEEGILKDYIQQEAINLAEYMPVLEDAITSMAKNSAAAIKDFSALLSNNSLDISGLKAMEKELANVNDLMMLNAKYTKLQADAQKAKTLADTAVVKQIKAETDATKAQVDLNAKLNKQKQDSIKLTNEQIAQKQLENKENQASIAYIKNSIIAHDQQIGTLQRLQAANANLRADRSKLIVTDSDYAIKLAAINTQLDTNNQAIIQGADDMKRQAMNVGNYMGGFESKLRPLTELIRGLAYTMGMNIEGLREYSSLIRGVTYFSGENAKKTQEQTKAQTEQIKVDETGNAIKKEQIILTEEQMAANKAATLVSEASIPVLGWVLAGTLALGAGIAYAITMTEAHHKAIDERSKAIDGSIIYDENLRKSYEDDIELIKKITDEYRVFMGTMSESDMQIDISNNNLKRKLQDIANSTAKAMEDAQHFYQKWAWYQTFAKAETGNEDMSKDEIKAYEKGLADKLTAEQEHWDKMVDLSKSNYEKLQDANDSYNQELIKNSGELSKAKNAFIRNDYKREQANAKIDHDTDVAIVESKLHNLNTLHKGDLDYTYKYNELKKEEDNIDKLYSEKKNERAEENKRTHIKQLAEEYAEAAKLTNDKKAAENEAYQVKAIDLHSSQPYLQGTDQEKKLMNENLQKEHLANLTEIQYEAEQKWVDIDKQANELILNKYDQQRAKAQQTYDDELKSYKKLLDEELKSTDEAVRKDAQLRYDAKVGLAGQQLTQTKTAINTEQDTNNFATRDSIQDAALKNKTDADKIAYKNYQTIHADQQREIAADYAKEYDAQKAADDKKVLEGTMTAEQEKDDLLNIRQTYDNKAAENDKEFKAAELDREVKQAEALTNAVAEGLQKRSDMLQQADQMNIDQHTRLMNVQTQLASEGRKNVLAQEEADTEKAEEKKLQDAKKAQKEQEAIQLANIVLELTAAYAKAGNTDSPEFKALAVAMATKGLAMAISGYYEGTESLSSKGAVKIGTGKDNLLIRAHEGEKIIGVEDSKKLGGMSNKDVVDAALLYKNMDFDNIYIPNYKSSNSTYSTTKVSTQYEELIKVFERQTEKIIRSYEQKPVYKAELGRLGEWVEEVEQNGMTEKTNYYRRGGRPRL